MPWWLYMAQAVWIAVVSAVFVYLTKSVLLLASEVSDLFEEAKRRSDARIEDLRTMLMLSKSVDHIWRLLTSTPSDDNADGDLNTFVVGDMVEHASGVGEVVEVDVFGCTVSFSCESTPRWVPHQELSHLMVGYRIIGGPPEVPEA